MTTAFEPGQRVRGRNFLRVDFHLNDEFGTIEQVVPAGAYLDPYPIPSPWLCYVVCWDSVGVRFCSRGAHILTLHENLAPVDEDEAKHEADAFIAQLKQGVSA